MARYIQVKHKKADGTLFKDDDSYEILYWDERRLVISPTNDIGSAEWSPNGLKRKYKIVNTGNGYELKLGNRKINLDYSQASELMTLMRVLMSNDGYQRLPDIHVSTLLKE